MANLSATIEALAAEFARGVMAALRGASLSDLSEVTSGGGGRPRAVRAIAARAGRRGRTARPGWPKCQTCGKNAHPRGKGYCWQHALDAGVVKGAGGPTKQKKKRNVSKAKKK